MTELKNLKSMFRNNGKVVENYFFMTALQLFSSAFGILIYPYLIRVLGSESYGTYVFAISVISYFSALISFGFNFPAIKAIVENKEDIFAKSDVVSSVITAKIYLAIISTIIFLSLLFFIPLMTKHWVIFVICFTQIIGEVLFPTWYFQGVQKMHIITYIQLTFRILSIPFIFIFVKNPADCWIFALITSLTVILSAFSSIIFLLTKEKILLKLVSIKFLKIYFKDATPFFLTSFASSLKTESITIIIAAFFNMKDVAIYDLANKIVSVPRIITMSINEALFPKIVENVKKNIVKKIILYESLIGLTISFVIIIFGRWFIAILAGNNMLEAYPLSIILSGTILIWMVVGSYISFIFVPANKYYFVTRNQIIALVSYFLFCIIGLLIFKSIVILAISLLLSGICEIIYCNYLINKYKLL